MKVGPDKAISIQKRSIMKIYTYAIINSGSALSSLRTQGSIKGLDQAQVYSISYRDIGVVVSNFNGELQDMIKSTAVQHEEVVEKLMENFTVLPMKLTTLFSRKEDVLSMMEKYYDDFKGNLNRLHGKVEFGLKVLWDADAVKKRLASDSLQNNCQTVISGTSPGKDFIKRKFTEHIADKGFKEEADKRIREIDSFFSKFAAEKKLEKLRSTTLLLSVAYLVEKTKQDRFRQAFEHLKRNIPPELKYMFSGPWPPYNFIALNKRDKI